MKNSLGVFNNRFKQVEKRISALKKRTIDSEFKEKKEKK